MYTVYKCSGCNEERETPLGGCFALNPLGVAPKGCLYMEDCEGTWEKVSASELAETATSASSNTASMQCPFA